MDLEIASIMSSISIEKTDGKYKWYNKIWVHLITYESKHKSSP